MKASFALVALLAACHAAIPVGAGPVMAAADRVAIEPPSAAPQVPIAPSAPSRGRIWGSFPLSLVGAAVGALAGVIVIGSSLGCSDEGAGCSNGPDNGEYIAGGLLMGVGAAAGAYVGGLRHDSRGRFWVDLLAAMVPASIVAIASGASNSEDACGDICLVPIFATPVVATAADYVFRVSR